MPPAEGAHAHADQRQTDGHDHRAGDHRREEAAQGFEEGAQHRLKQAAHNGGTHHGAVAQDAAAHDGVDALEHADEAGTGTHDDGHLAADGAHREQLDQRDDAGHQHGVLEQRHLDPGEFLRPAAGRTGTGDDQDGGQVAHEHGQHMLQAQGYRLTPGQFALELVGSDILLVLDFLFHLLAAFPPTLGFSAVGQKFFPIILTAGGMLSIFGTL